MASTITWSITNESHADRTEKYIEQVNYLVKIEETIGSGDEAKTYKAQHDGIMSLAKPDTLIPYATFNKQSTLIDAVKANLGSEQVTNIENFLKESILEQTDPLDTVPPS